VARRRLAQARVEQSLSNHPGEDAMSAQSMLEQLLKSGLSLLDPQGAQGSPRAGARASRGWGEFGAGAATGGALGLLLGSKRGRSFGGKALKYGSMAALGVVAYRAYGAWQARQAQAPGATPATQIQPLERLPAPAIEQHSRAMLTAMIAAAKSDGHLDERERGLLEAELGRLEADPAQRQWVEEEVRRPLDPTVVARAATSPAMASEMYLASLLIADDTSFMERAYLDELARQLQLPADLQAELEAQARASGTD